MGEENVPAVCYLVTARKDAGVPQLELQYPSTTRESESLLLQRVFPSVAAEEDWTVFHLGRRLEMEITKRIKRRQTVIDPQELHIKTIDLFVYELNETSESGTPEWEMMGEDMMVALLEPNTIQLIDDSDQSEIASIAPHFDLEFTELEECFGAVLCDNGSILGFRFQNVEDEITFMLKLEELCQKVAKSKKAKTAESNIPRYIGSQLTCLSVIRGDMALCMCTQLQYVHPFKPILEAMIGEYEKNPTEETLETIFNTLNALELPGREELPKTLPLSLFDLSYQVNFPKLSVKDQIFPTNFRFLFQTFKEQTAHIYNCVITEKRVVFYSSSNVSSVCDCVMTAGMLVNPIFGVSKDSTFPRTSMDCRFYHSLKYIAGLSDAQIENESQHWDLLCNVDTGSVTWNKSVDSLFIEESTTHENFFNQVYERVQLKHSEDSIWRVVRQYTRRFIDAAVGRGFFATAEDAVTFSLHLKRRTLFWSASKACERWESTIDARAVKDVGVDKAIQQFLFCKALEEGSIIDLFSKIKSAASSPEKIAEIRTIIDHYNCLDIIACTMMHTSLTVRDAARMFLYSLKYMAPKDTELNPMFRFIYKRLKVAEQNDA